MKKRLTSLVMVFVLALSLGTVALATQNHPAVTPGSGTATIYIEAEGTPIYSGSISGLTLENGLTSLTSTALFTEVSDWYNSSIKHDAMYSLYGYATDAGTFSDLPNGTFSYDGVNYTAQNTTAVANHNGYFLLKVVHNVYDPNDETYKDQYHYLYIGKDWVYSDDVNGTIYVYMCDYALDGQEIDLIYDVQTTAWATFTPIS